jgi:uncharacterized protein YkwD
MTSRPRRWRLSALLVVCAVLTAALLSPTATAQEQADDGEITVVEIPSDAQVLRRWLTIWDVNDLVLLLDEFYRQLGPVRVCPDGDAADRTCYLDFTRRGAAADPGSPAAGDPDDPAAAGEPEASASPSPSATPDQETASPAPAPSPEPPTSPTASPGPDPTPPGASENDKATQRSPNAAIEQRVVDLVNEDRRREGFPPLEVDPALAAGARRWTAEMASRGQLAHDSDLRVPPNASTVGENVAFRTTGEHVAERLHEQFMNSPGHRRNVLNPAFTRVGVGVVQSGDLTWITERFAG